MDYVKKVLIGFVSEEVDDYKQLNGMTVLSYRVVTLLSRLDCVGLYEKFGCTIISAFTYTH